ncbi:MAG: hypothetical protein Q9167_001896 [Letrouitia subvulpina]
MTSKLDQSLDDIVTTKRTARRGRGTRRVANTRAKAAGPAGGVAKNTRATKAAVKAAIPTGPASGTVGDSKIIVSNLPSDVTEQNVKEYFGDTIGPVKRVNLTYGPDGRMKGIVTIVFARPDSASMAQEKLNGVQVDKKPMKIEVVLDASKAIAVAQLPVKTLSDRINKTNGPKQATAAAKPAKNGTGTRGGRAARGRGRRGRNAGRAKPKTADELDAEMVDYFDATNAPGNAAPNGPQPTTTGGDDLGMDEISVSFYSPGSSNEPILEYRMTFDFSEA